MSQETVKQLRLYLEFLHEGGVEYVPKDSSGSGPIGPLEEVRRLLGECKRCPLWKTRNHLVFGEGNPYAKLMFVGEAPGREEDLQGRPFVGQAGKLLTQFLQSIGLSRDEVYIANVLKCRPPGNRTPQPQEIEACLPFLLKQIQAIQPRIICTLGAVATQTLLGQRASITRIRGQSLPWRWGIKLFPTFHPAYLLRNPGQKKNAYQDFLRLKELLEAQA